MIFNHCAVSSNLAKCRKAIFYITKVPSRSVAQDYTTKINNAEARFPVPVESHNSVRTQILHRLSQSAFIFIFKKF